MEREIGGRGRLGSNAGALAGQCGGCLFLDSERRVLRTPTAASRPHRPIPRPGGTPSTGITPRPMTRRTPSQRPSSSSIKRSVGNQPAPNADSPSSQVQPPCAVSSPNRPQEHAMSPPATPSPRPAPASAPFLIALALDMTPSRARTLTQWAVAPHSIS